VPASVAMIVSAYTGDALLTEEQFVEMASDLGLFGVDYADASVGMTVDNALVLLEAAGVPADLVVGDMGSLTEALEEGRGVMLFVDSGEIWHGEEGSANGTDHALVVTGIDTENGVAYLSDPGHPDGNMMQVPLSVLEDAWEDGGFTMIVCDEPAPRHTGEDASPQPTASLTDAPWAMLPVVLPAGSVTAA
jgi:hypothetical protein